MEKGDYFEGGKQVLAMITNMAQGGVSDIKGFVDKLNNSLETLNCSYNQLTSLPELNNALVILVCDDNSFPSFISIDRWHLNQEKKTRINNEFQRLYRFKLLFWSLKYKSKFRDWLWIRVRLPKIEKTYHPSKLNELLNSDMSEEELDNVLVNW